MGCIVYKVFSFNNPNDFGKHKVLGWISKPGVKNPIGLGKEWKESCATSEQASHLIVTNNKASKPAH